MNTQKDCIALIILIITVASTIGMFLMWAIVLDEYFYTEKTEFECDIKNFTIHRENNPVKTGIYFDLENCYKFPEINKYNTWFWGYLSQTKIDRMMNEDPGKLTLYMYSGHQFVPFTYISKSKISDNSKLLDYRNYYIMQGRILSLPIILVILYISYVELQRKYKIIIKKNN